MMTRKSNCILGMLALSLVSFLAWIIVTESRSSAAGASDYN